jgi:hypothetical protein
LKEEEARRALLKIVFGEAGSKLSSIAPTIEAVIIAIKALEGKDR